RSSRYTSPSTVFYTLSLHDALPIFGLDYKIKFGAQLIAAMLFPLSGLWINDMYGVLFITYLPAWVGMPLTVFAVILIINAVNLRSEEHTSELQSRENLVCRLLLEKK